MTANGGNNKSHVALQKVRAAEKIRRKWERTVPLILTSSRKTVLTAWETNQEWGMNHKLENGVDASCGLVEVERGVRLHALEWASLECPGSGRESGGVLGKRGFAGQKTRASTLHASVERPPPSFTGTGRFNFPFSPFFPMVHRG